MKNEITIAISCAKGGVGEEMRYVTGVYWCRGRSAKENQDAVVLQQVLTRRGRVLMAAVCDGMGGIAAGEEASGYAACQLREWFYRDLLPMLRRRKRFWVIRRSLDRLVFHMQSQLKQYAAGEEIALGTTMTVVVLWEKTYLLWHLGDSRAYRLQGRQIAQLTTDHVHDGDKLTKCLGSFGYFKPQHRMGVLRRGEGILLCTDGFRRQMAKQELGDVLHFDRRRLPAAGEEEQITRRLGEIGEACMKRGETDNLSAVYVKCCM